ncbi:MAG: hypothetical protein IPH93_16525 [Saprospiraceae bacterium]|nr:hypothetical protein [Saprospiraceae bacterium]
MKVKNSNIFRAQNKSLVDHFIISYFATDDALRSYCKAGIPQKWIRAAKDTSFPKINVSDYEESLINFFKSRIKNEKSHPILVLVGGIGTGKSSTIRYALHTSNICNNCSYSSICTRDYGSRIIIDFINFKSTLDTYSEDAKYNKSLRKSQVKEFWINILKILDIVLKEEMGIEIEISDFWIWLVNDKRDSISIEIYKLLYPKREMFSNSVQNSAELRNLRTEFYTELSIANLVKYKLLQISFLRKDKMANCNFIIFDNTDTLPPKLQKKVIDFSIYANNLLHCISIIPLRPSTLFANRDASTFFDLKEHWKPSLQNIFYTRLENYKKNGDQDVYLLLKMLIDTIRDNKFFSDVIISTSGKSIRYALRNFYKFCLSPLIVTHVDGKPVEYILLQTNSFYQAYFCSDSELQVMDEENFTNMLALRTSPMNSFFFKS